MIGYAGANHSMWCPSQYLEFVERKDSLLGLKQVHLKSVCWMDPWGRIENIPGNVHEVDLYFYHVIHN